VQIHILALNPTASVTEGFLPAAQRLEASVTLLTDTPEAYHAGGPLWRTRENSMITGETCRVVRCNVRDAGQVVGCISELGRPNAIFTNSDHLQVQAALAAAYFALPGKDWTAALRTKNKALMRRHLAQAGIDAVASVEIAPDDDPNVLTAATLPYPCVLKPREGVASEDVVLVQSHEELTTRVDEIRRRRPTDALVVEEHLDGPLHTLETFGDTSGSRRVLGGFQTRLSPPPYFVEQGLDWDPDLPAAVRLDVLRQLDALGVGLGACHTEFVRQGDRARLVEVNYRIIGDHGDLLLAELLGEPLFELVLRVHLGDDVAGVTPAPTDHHRHGRVEYVCARTSGTLRTAPEAQDLDDGKTVLRYRPRRSVGHPVELTHTNRDYLGVLRAIGDDRPAVDRAVEDFLAAHSWEIRP
jgi:biotin carboxylase